MDMNCIFRGIASHTLFVSGKAPFSVCSKQCCGDGRVFGRAATRGILPHNTILLVICSDNCILVQFSMILSKVTLIEISI